MNILKLFALSIGLMTSFGICNNAFCMEEVDSVKQEKAKYYKSFHDIYNAIDKLYESYSNEYNIFAGEDDYNNKLVNKFCLSEYNNISTTFKNLPKDEQHGYNEELYNKICDMLQSRFCKTRKSKIL